MNDNETKIPVTGWCEDCDQSLDLPSEFFDGTEVSCWGCGDVYVLVAYTDGSWGTVPLEDYEEDLGEALGDEPQIEPFPELCPDKPWGVS